MARLNAGIIGLGVGEQHVEGFERHPDCKVVSLCDIDSAKRYMAHERYPDCAIVDDATALLDDPDIDIVSIASYDDCHYEQIVRAIASGKHIFVEKPFCMHAHEAQHIRKLLEEKPELRISSNLILRKSPRFIRLREMIRSGRMGDIFHVEADYNYGRLQKIVDGWRGSLEFYSILYGGGIHVVDLLLWLTGDEVVEVSAYGNNIASRGSGFRFNDMVVGILKFKSGAVGKVTANFGCVFPHFHQLTVYGTQATFVNARPDGLLYTSRDPQVDPEPVTEAYPGTHKGDLLTDFVSSILDDGDAGITTEEIFTSMSVCFALEKAMTEQRPVTVEYI